MSYSCYVSVKKVAPKDVFDFFKTFKKAIYENAEEIVKNNIYYSPVKYLNKEEIKLFTSDLPDHDAENWWECYKQQHLIRERFIHWIREIFQYRMCYIKEKHLLAIFGVADELMKLFDGNYYFQNSCDQNYDYKDWKGVKCFEDIAKKWKTMPIDELIDKSKEYDKVHYHYTDEEFNELYLVENKFDEDYQRKSLCYAEIWSYFEPDFENDKEAIYFSALREFDDIRLIEKLISVIIKRIKY